MKTYIPNNINFRIVSSNSIAKFKQDQAFDFYEIVKLGDKITAPAKEVILLEYDHWFKWITQLEKVFLLLNEEDTDETIFNQVQLLFRSGMDDIIDTMTSYTNFFKPEMTNFVKFIHKYSLEAFLTSAKITIVENDLGVAFSTIVFNISIYLQQVFFAMRELEEILLNDDPEAATEIFYSGWCKELCAVDNGECSGVCSLVVERAKYYAKLKNNNKFIVNNTTKNCFNDQCLRKMNSHNIEIVEVKNARAM